MVAMTRAQAIATLTGPGQPHELHDGIAGGRHLRLFRTAPASLRDLFADNATSLPFIKYEDEQLSYAQAWQQASRIGQMLVDGFGVQRGDRVAIAMRNYPEWMLAFTAVTSIGAVAVALNALWEAEELAYGLQDCGAKVLFADAERLQRLARVSPLPGLHVIAVRTDDPGSATPLEALLAPLGEMAMPAAQIAADDAATIFYTSGSTGHPKGVVSSHRNILAALLSWELDRRIGELVSGTEPPAAATQPGTLLAVPLFHVTASHAVYLSSYRAQRRLVCMGRWNAEAAAALIGGERLTSFVAPAAMTGDLLLVARSGRHDLGSLLAVGGGGAPRAPEQVRRIGASFGQALPNTGWGMTETNAIGTSIAGEDYLAHPASSGRCSQVLALKVVDERGETLPAGQRGELLVRGTSVFAGYWNRPEANLQVFQDGWFRTGDVALIDEQGYLFIVDRIKDLIIRGGENIGCGHVEAALLMHPEVHEAAVYAVPDERLGEEVGATVYGSDRLDIDALREFLATHLARFEVPRYIVRSPTPLPRTPSGKILKRQIKDAALSPSPSGDTAATPARVDPAQMQ
ncbi:MAG: class I adenylate-forming enzyme family protein [Rubrivivax sp.]